MHCHKDGDSSKVPKDCEELQRKQTKYKGMAMSMGLLLQLFGGTEAADGLLGLDESLVENEKFGELKL